MGSCVSAETTTSSSSSTQRVVTRRRIPPKQQDGSATAINNNTSIGSHGGGQGVFGDIRTVPANQVQVSSWSSNGSRHARLGRPDASSSSDDEDGSSSDVNLELWFEREKRKVTKQQEDQDRRYSQAILNRSAQLHQQQQQQINNQAIHDVEPRIKFMSAVPSSLNSSDNRSPGSRSKQHSMCSSFSNGSSSNRSASQMSASGGVGGGREPNGTQLASLLTPIPTPKQQSSNVGGGATTAPNASVIPHQSLNSSGLQNISIGREASQQHSTVMSPHTPCSPTASSQHNLPQYQQQQSQRKSIFDPSFLAFALGPHGGTVGQQQSSRRGTHSHQLHYKWELPTSRSQSPSASASGGGVPSYATSPASYNLRRNGGERRDSSHSTSFSMGEKSMFAATNIEQNTNPLAGSPHYIHYANSAGGESSSASNSNSSGGSEVLNALGRAAEQPLITPTKDAFGTPPPTVPRETSSTGLSSSPIVSTQNQQQRHYYHRSPPHHTASPAGLPSLHSPHQTAIVGPHAMKNNSGHNTSILPSLKDTSSHGVVTASGGSQQHSSRIQAGSGGILKGTSGGGASNSASGFGVASGSGNKASFSVHSQ